MGTWKFLKVFLLVFSCHMAESANILALFSSLSFSDHLVFRGYVSKLSQAGHSIVTMTAYPGHYAFPEKERIVELDVSQESLPFWNEWLKLVTNTDDYYTRLQAINEFSIKLAIAQLRSKQMTALFINPNVKFDLVITEADVPLLYGAAEKYQAPHIAITTSSGKIHQYEAKGTPVHPILYPDVNALNYRDMSIWEKVVELNRHVRTKSEYYNNYLSLSDLAAKKIFELKTELKELENDIDLLLIAANPILTGNRPTGPAVIHTDRLHLTPGFALPQVLKATLEAATKGVIYFSMGAIQESESLAPHLLQTLADTFRELPFTVLWKIGNTTAFDKPENVIAGSWFPQQEVLAHPNVKAFITHGGPRSLEEALFYQVPIVGLPIVKSRRVFIKEMTKHGVGEILDPYFLNKEELKAKISAVATDEQYKVAMTKLKAKVIDPVISGPEKAVWWTNYVLRNGGARHLHVPGSGVSFCEYALLDLFSLFLVGALASIWIFCAMLRFAVRKFRARFFGVGARLANKKEDRKFKAL